MNRPKTVVLTGATGFIGSALLERFARIGWQVVALSRRPPETGATIIWERYDLEGAVPSGIFAGADVLVHTAFVSSNRHTETVAVNFEGSRRLHEAARAAGVPQCIFISSIAADPCAYSDYGKHKYATEQLFQGSGDAIVRPGLVLGNGGLFKRMCDHLRQRPVVPLIGGGKQPLQTVDIADLGDAIIRIAEQRLCGTFTIAQPEPVAYEHFYRDLGAALSVRVRFVPIPYWVAELSVTIARWLQLATPIGRDNILGLKGMKHRRCAADLQSLGLHLRPYAQSLDLAAQG